jgi:hypothetical protein
VEELSGAARLTALRHTRCVVVLGVAFRLSVAGRWNDEADAWTGAVLLRRR